MEYPELVNKIEKIELEGTGTPPSHYYIKVSGIVLHDKYTKPLLVIKSNKPDKDGNLIYYFSAEPPESLGAEKPYPIVATRYLYDLTGVKRLTFVSATNEMYTNV
jgi:hypothetical protein